MMYRINDVFGARFMVIVVAKVMDKIHDLTHCSALVKVTGNYSDMFFGHSAWYELH
jgi:hypothetical protein